MSSEETFLDNKNIKKLDKEIQRISGSVGVDRKTIDEVFDKSTLHSLEKLISRRVIDIVEFPISTGKEGNVFRAVTPKKKFVAVKIYRISTSTFKHISQYIIGDPRFKKINKNRRTMIYEWTKKEFKNLELLNEIGVYSPKPIDRLNNVLVMQYLGTAKSPAPMLKDILLKNPKKIFDELIDFIYKMYKDVGLVHSDLSVFNILIYRNKPYLIDLGQGVLLEHPLSQEFLKRDIHNIVSYFRKYGIDSDENEIYNGIIKTEKR